MTTSGGADQDIGVVVIGRNEGERLRRCLLSLQDVRLGVYVDSGSTDGSQALARQLGFHVVDLPVPPGFTAARARNAGLRHLLTENSSVGFIQMVDGDCEVHETWISAARSALDSDSSVAVVFGRLRERHPDATIYNRMCDFEWDVPVGDAKSCGGIAMFRVGPLLEAGGYSDALIAGEEPDLCLRLRQRGWKIRRIGADMAFHDAAMSRFSQWWRRAERAGHSFAELSHRHGRRADSAWFRQLSSAVLWSSLGIAGVFSLAIGALFAFQSVLLVGFFGVCLFALQGIRVAKRRISQGASPSDAFTWASLIMVAKFAELQGILLFHMRRLTGRTTRIIEHKG